MSVETLVLDEAEDKSPSGQPAISNYLELIQNVKVNVEVVVGGSSISVGELMQLKKDSIIKLDKDVNEPLEIMLDGKLVALGVLAAVDDNFAIKITHVSENSLPNAY